MNTWDYGVFDEKLGKATEFGLIIGDQFTGKSTLATYMNSQFGYHVIEMKGIMDKIRASKSTEEEPYEGEIKIAEVEKEIVGFIDQKQKSGDCRVKFVFDGFMHASAKDFVTFIDTIGTPQFILSLTAPADAIKQRYCKKNETDDIPEDAGEEFKQKEAAAAKNVEDLRVAISAKLNRIKFHKIDTGCSEFSTLQ